MTRPGSSMFAKQLAMLAMLGMTAGCTTPGPPPANAEVQAAQQLNAQARFSYDSIAMPDGRNLQVEIGLPSLADAPKAPLAGIILFAHGANLAPEQYRALTRPWVQAGYAVISPRFIDSESHPQRESDDRGKILSTRLADFELAAQWATGSGQFEAQYRRGGPEITHIRQHGDGPMFAAGHSYGAYIAQILGGATVFDAQSEKAIGLTMPDRLRGIIALSPPPTFPGFSPVGSWAGIKLPMLVQSGTTDISPPFVTNWQQNFDSHCEAPAGQSRAVIYKDIDHNFGGMLGRISADPDPAATQNLSRFGALTLMFMARAGHGSIQSDFDAQIAQFSDNAAIRPTLKCPHRE